MRRITRKLLVLICLCCFAITFILISNTTKSSAAWLVFQGTDEVTKTLILQLKKENRELRLRLASSSMTSCQSTGAAARLHLKGPYALDHELELPPASLFTHDHVFPAEPSQGGRMLEKIRGPRRADLQLAIQNAARLLCENNLEFSEENFVEGNFLLEAKNGVQFEMIFNNKRNGEYYKATIIRPFAPFEFYKVEANINKKEIINIILPLSGRIQSFKTFMKRFYMLSLYDGHINLTIVYFGYNKLAEVKKILAKYERDIRPKFLVLNETFSRAKALRVGATELFSTDSNDALLFFCDVDVIFTTRFLERCRWNTISGRQVFYPILFSLYNPRVVYQLNGKSIPSENQQLVISKDTGFWRDFGYGMTCQYRSDFLRLVEMSFEHTTWGGEDVALYRKFVKDPQIRVLRVTDPALFHVWHSKHCNSSMRSAQRYACLKSRARTEASHAQLGLLVYSNASLG